jgi:hypothetical protein
MMSVGLEMIKPQRERLGARSEGDTERWRKEESNNGSKNWRGTVVFHYEILVTRLWLFIKGLFFQSVTQS